MPVFIELITEMKSMVTYCNQSINHTAGYISFWGLLGAASLASYLSDDQMYEINTTLISQLQQKGIKPDAVRTYIQTIGSVR